jgi:hypothetical protein
MAARRWRWRNPVFARRFPWRKNRGSDNGLLMNVLDQLGIALGFATLAGLNLYLTVLVAGLAIRFQWIHLGPSYENLAVLGNGWLLGLAAVLFLIEFFADKVPWLDSAWDGAHTVVRPVGGILLALAALGDIDPRLVIIAALLAGTASLATHGTKSGTRLFLNLSPEPVSNAVASTTEDGLVLGGLGVMAFAPAAGFFLFLAVVVACGCAAVWLWRRIARLRRWRIPRYAHAGAA